MARTVRQAGAADPLHESLDGPGVLGLADPARLGGDDDALAEKLAHNVEVLKAISVQIFHKAAGECLKERAPDPVARIDATAIGLDPERWEEGGLFSDGGMDLEEARALAPGIEALWFESANAGQRAARRDLA